MTSVGSTTKSGYGRRGSSGKVSACPQRHPITAQRERTNANSAGGRSDRVRRRICRDHPTRRRAAIHARRLRIHDPSFNLVRVGEFGSPLMGTGLNVEHRTYNFTMYYCATIHAALIRIYGDRPESMPLANLFHCSLLIACAIALHLSRPDRDGPGVRDRVPVRSAGDGGGPGRSSGDDRRVRVVRRAPRAVCSGRSGIAIRGRWRGRQRRRGPGRVDASGRRDRSDSHVCSVYRSQLPAAGHPAECRRAVGTVCRPGSALRVFRGDR